MSRQIALAWGVASATLIALSPWAPHIAGGLWSCVFKALTGIPCPTCGTVRAALALARFDVGSALMHYPLPAIGWMLFVGGGLVAAVTALAGRTPPAIPTSLSGWARAGIVSVVLLNWAYSIATGV